MIDLNKYYNATTFQGASAAFDGRSGFVPKALSGDELKFLRGDGTWQEVSGGGDPAVNTVVYTNSATWIDTSTVVQSNSASWGTGGGTTSIPTTGIHIPAPTLKWQRTSPGQVLPDLFVTYTPTLTSTWLTPQTEVWVFVYRKPKKKTWASGGWVSEKYVSGYVHPVDTDKGAANGGKPLYGGDTPGKVFHTEFSFTSGDQLPAPYQQVPLTAFNPLEFYAKVSNQQQVSASDFPFDWDTNSHYDIYSPRMLGKIGGKEGKNLTTYYQFKFAIPNPDTSSKYPKLFGPPAYLKVRPKFTNGSGDGVPRGAAGSFIEFMTYASEFK